MVYQSRSNLIRELLASRAITPGMSREPLITRAQLLKIKTDPVTAAWMKKRREDFLPYLSYAITRDDKKTIISAFINREIMMAHRQDFAPDQSKRDRIDSLRAKGYKGNLKFFNKNQLVDLNNNFIQAPQPIAVYQAPPPAPIIQQPKPVAQPNIPLGPVRPNRAERKRIAARNRPQPNIPQQLPAQRLTRQQRRTAAIRAREAQQPVARKKVYRVTEHTNIDFLIRNLHLATSILHRALRVGMDQYTINLPANEMLLLQKDVSPFRVIFELITAMIQQTITRNGLDPTDKMQFRLVSSSIRGKIWSRFILVDQMTATEVTERIVSALQSVETIEIVGMQIGLVYIKIPSGGARSMVTKQSDYDDKKGYKTIINNDELCFARALFVSLKNLAWKDGVITKTAYQSAIKLRYPTPILEMFKAVGIEPRRINIADIPLFEQHFETTINIISYDQENRCIYPVATDKQFNKQVYLHLISDHYNSILNIDAVLVINQNNTFCNGCKMVQSFKHKCENLCNRSNCHLCALVHDHTPDEVHCDTCQRNFTNPICFENHKAKICSRVFICQKCDKYITLNGHLPEHHCGKDWCQNCFAEKPLDHNCYIRTLKEPKRVINGTCQIFYDYETYTNEDGVHTPNLIVARKSDAKGVQSTHIFYINNDFCSWLFTKEHKGYTCIAHYSKGFDIHLIKEYLYTCTPAIKFEVIDTGMKTMYLETYKPNIRFIDSISFFACPLKVVPKTFGLDTSSYKKGYFPHYYNKKENQNYVGPYPEISMYGYDQMKPDDAEKFLDWHTSMKDQIFDFKQEFLEYCIMDVEILQEGWLAFTKIFLHLEISPGKLNTLDPTHFITIASYVNAIYRTYFMPRNSIAIIKDTNQNASVAELEWMLHMEKNVLDTPLERQYKIGKYFLDGYDPNTHTAYEFNGCYFHGCNKCFPNQNRVNQNNGKTMRMLLRDTMIKREFLQEQGCVVVTMWEHTWKTERKKHLDFLSENADLLRCPEIKLRKAFFGGRTEAFDTYAKSSEDVQIAYADFTSLYPSIQGLCDFPIGVGRHIRDNFESIDKYFGFIYCRVSCPQDIHIPVLPETRDGKLMFHTKPMIGQWFSEELKLAVRMGYVVEEIFGVYQYDRKGKQLFGDYVRFFSKIKMENSVKDLSEENKDMIYNENKNARFPIILDRSKMTFNAGLRAISKLCLNSLWGKFGQRVNMMKTLISRNDTAAVYKIVLDNTLELHDINFLPMDTVELKYKRIDDDPIESRNTNVSIAACTTGWARVWLYEAMLKVGPENVHYCDTDSLIYSHPTGNNPIKTDSCLGGLTDELEGSYIEELVALAPKTYAYQTSDGHLEVKAKRFS